jgi:hypothetical protein
MKHLLHPAIATALTLPLMTSLPLDDARAQTAGARAYEAPIVFQAAGPDGASIQASVDGYRAALGEVNNCNAPGPLATATSIAATPFAGFLNTRGALFVTPGSGFVQAPASGLADTFGNADYAAIFAAFSPVRLFSPIGSTRTDVEFFVPGSGGGLPATTRGFGAILSDVDLPDGSGPGDKRGNRKASTLVQYFALDGELLYSSFVPASPGDGGFAFLGVVFDDARVARVRIRTGNALPGADDERPQDVAVMDDFIFGEPQLAQ